MERPAWVKDKKVADDFDVIKAPALDDIKDFVMDKGCYVLIKLYKEEGEIGVGVCNYEHVILMEFRGVRAKDIWNAIFKYEEEKNIKWFNTKDHIAYLGKELAKAEYALKNNLEYEQE
tara:strand:- start:1091 stop:1444 length:354 start_codon:yes stop_codon:yes gene_type:complete